LAEVQEESTPPATAIPRTRLYNSRFVVLAAACLVLIVALSGFFHARNPAPSPSTEFRQVTTAEAYDVSPTFSPYGTSIAYASDKSGNFEIYVRSVSATGREIQITSDGQGNLDPAWSPDGKLSADHANE